MKKLLFLLAVSAFFCACDNADKSNNISADAIEINDGTSNAEPKFEFKETTWDFGTIMEGERVEHTFKFTNVGDDDLIISNASASCGCTIPAWPREPIAPGEEGKIKVEFNSQGKSGNQSKDITILANTNPVKTVLVIKSFVKKK